MILRNGDREYAHWACEHVPDDAPLPYLLDATGDPVTGEWWTATGRTWDKLLRALGTTQAEIDAGTVRIARVLLTTPDAGPPGAMFLPGTTPAPLRWEDAPEVLTRGDGRITVL